MATLKRGLSNEAFAAAKADAAAESKAARFNSKRTLKGGKYPGRNLVMARSDVLDLNYRQMVQAQGDSPARAYQCTNPYVVSAIGLPDAVGAMTRYWKGEHEGKAFAQVESRCRKCEACLKHRRRLWTARATDELKAAHRTWFATLTVAPAHRFLARIKADALAVSAGHGNWHSLEPETKFRYLVKVLNMDLDKYLKRVRKTGSPFRYLLVSEAHEDGFPHFHLLIHEAALPLTKRKLESEWRLGFSQFRLVDSANNRSAYYVCKYLAKSAQTRVRASKRYGRNQILVAATERIGKIIDALA